MADVFISYSKAHADITRSLAKDIEAQGLSVWWDTEMVQGESFRRRILEEIKAAKAVVVVWTPESIRSDYVHSEAERGRIAGKLIQLKTADVEPHDLPPPFDTSHAADVADRGALMAGLARFGLLPDYTPDPSAPLPIYGASRSRGWLGWRPTALIATGIMALVALGIGLTNLSRAPDAARPEASEAAAATAARKVLVQLGSGIPDSSVFAADVRLGKRGLMNRVEAVTELRKVQAVYPKIVCRIDGPLTPVTNSGQNRTSTRMKFLTACDMTDKSGVVSTQRVPLEVETTPDGDGTHRVSGLWQPEAQLFWQAR
jgi:hypothetical protein